MTYEVYGEDGISHKAERAVAGAASSGVNIALSGVAGTTVAAVIAAAAPVALSVAAAAATAKVADLATENRRATKRWTGTLPETPPRRKFAAGRMLKGPSRRFSTTSTWRRCWA